MSERFNLRTPEGCDGFVIENWEPIAYRAYDGYLLYGRGAVVIRGNAGAPEFFQYSPLGADYGNAELEQCVREYDPNRELVCMFVLKGLAATFGRYESDDPDLIPPLVYKVMCGLRGDPMH